MTQVMISDYELIKKSLIRLAGRCDGAQVQDEIGFNKPDSFRGKFWADFLSRGGQLTESEQIAAITMLQKYHAQLFGIGIDLPVVSKYMVTPLPKVGPKLAPAPVTAPAPSILIDAIAGELVVSFPYNPDTVGKIKRLPQRKFNPTSKRWHVPPALIDQLKAILPSAQITASALGLCAITPLTNDLPVVAPVAPKPFTITLDNGNLILSFEYDAGLVAQVKDLPDRRWDKDRKLWIVPARHAETVCKRFPQALIDHAISGMIEGMGKSVLVDQPVGVEIESPLLKNLPDLNEPINGITLFAHQKEDVRRMINRGSMILAGDVGVGKSFCLMLVALAYHKDGCKVIVITKASLKDDIKRSADKIGVPIDVYSWAKIPVPPKEKYIMIADEAAMAQGGKSTIRGKAFLELALARNCKACYPATATPMRNGKPVNLYPLLKAIDAPFASNQKDYERKYCDAKPTRFTKWDTSGASGLQELHELCKPLIIRRKKIDCLDLPPQILTIRSIKLSPDALKKFNDVFNAAQQDYNERKSKGEIGAADALVMLAHLRRSNSIAKVGEAIELAEEILEQGSSVVISCEFLESAETIFNALKGYKAELLTGGVTGNEPGTNISKRQASMDRFQSGESKVFVMTGSAGGAGITLTRSQDMILVDRPMVSDDVTQLHGRCHRITQTGTVNLHWIQAGEIDQKIDDNLIVKDNKSGQVIDGKSVGDLSKDILAALFGGS